MPETLPDFRPVLAALQTANVRFVLIGGLAMSAHGSAYITQDIDVGYARDMENIRLLSQALAGMHPRLRGFPEDLPFVWDERTIRAAPNMKPTAPAPLFCHRYSQPSSEQERIGLWGRGISPQEAQWWS